jgi:hypothetical protein
VDEGGIDKKKILVVEKQKCSYKWQRQQTVRAPIQQSQLKKETSQTDRTYKCPVRTQKKSVQVPGAIIEVRARSPVVIRSQNNAPTGRIVLFSRSRVRSIPISQPPNAA